MAKNNTNTQNSYGYWLCKCHKSIAFIVYASRICTIYCIHRDRTMTYCFMTLNIAAFLIHLHVHSSRNGLIFVCDCGQLAFFAVFILMLEYLN